MRNVCLTAPASRIASTVWAVVVVEPLLQVAAWEPVQVPEQVAVWGPALRVLAGVQAHLVKSKRPPAGGFCLRVCWFQSVQLGHSNEWLLSLRVQRYGKVMNSEQQKEFLQATAWLRPWTRRAAAFSMKASGVLPQAIRNIPLRLVKRVLAGYQKRMNSGCKTS